MIKSKRCDGYCPICGSDNITYNDGYVDEGDYIYEITCDDCGKEFIEYNSITYRNTRWEE